MTYQSSVKEYHILRLFFFWMGEGSLYPKWSSGNLGVHLFHFDTVHLFHFARLPRSIPNADLHSGIDPNVDQLWSMPMIGIWEAFRINTMILIGIGHCLRESWFCICDFNQYQKLELKVISNSTFKNCNVRSESDCSFPQNIIQCTKTIDYISKTINLYLSLIL